MVFLFLEYWDDLLWYCKDPSSYHRRRVVKHYLQPMVSLSLMVADRTNKVEEVIPPLTYMALSQAELVDLAWFFLSWVEERFRDLMLHESSPLDLSSFQEFSRIKRRMLQEFFQVHSHYKQVHENVEQACSQILDVLWKLHWEPFLRSGIKDGMTFHDRHWQSLILNRPTSLSRVIGLNVLIDRFGLWLQPDGSVLLMYLMSEEPSWDELMILLTKATLELVLDVLVQPHLASICPSSPSSLKARLVLVSVGYHQNEEKETLVSIISSTEVWLPLSRSRSSRLRSLITDTLSRRLSVFFHSD